MGGLSENAGQLCLAGTKSMISYNPFTLNGVHTLNAVLIDDNAVESLEQRRRRVKRGLEAQLQKPVSLPQAFLFYHDSGVKMINAMASHELKITFPVEQSDGLISIIQMLKKTFDVYS